MWNGDIELFKLLKDKLFTAVIGDTLDFLGFTHQFLPPQIRPLRNDMIVVGRAMTVLTADLPETEGQQSNPFGLMLKALDDLKTNEVYLCTGGSPTYALWGEIMSMRAQQLGSSGAILNGYSRDTRGIFSLNFPTFSIGSYAQDQRSRGKVVDFRTGVAIGQARIESGDLIFGDLDGVIVIPREVEVETIRLAAEKASKEGRVMLSIVEEGVSSEQAFEMFGVL